MRTLARDRGQFPRGGICLAGTGSGIFQPHLPWGGWDGCLAIASTQGGEVLVTGGHPYHKASPWVVGGGLALGPGLVTLP